MQPFQGGQQLWTAADLAYHFQAGQIFESLAYSRSYNGVIIRQEDSPVRHASILLGNRGKSPIPLRGFSFDSAPKNRYP
jgi:hypothetical protein